MRKLMVVVLSLLLLGCKNEEEKTSETPETESEVVETPSLLSMDAEPIELTLEQANKLAELPLDCINVEYPNKLNQTLASGE